MASNEVSIKLTVDKREGESNLQAFQRTFTKLLTDLGKTPEEAKAFYQLVDWIEDGTVATQSLDKATQQLIEEYRRGKQVAQDADFLGIKRFNDAEREINEIRAAFDRLKQSGKLSGQEVAAAALKAEEAIAKVKKETLGWSEALNQAKGSLAGVVSAGAGLTAVAKQAIQFEDVMADVAKVVDADKQQIDSLAESLKKMSFELPLSADALAGLAAAGGQLGIPIDQLEQFTALAAKMTTAFQLSSEESGAAIAKMANVFKLSLTEVEDLGNAVNVLGNTMATNEASIIEVLTRIGATSQQFGLAKEEAAALAATVLSLGVQSNVAATGINGMLNKLQTASVLGDEAQVALARLGTTGEDLAKSIRDNPQKALIDFLKTLQDIDKQSRAEILTKIFGLEYQDDISKIVAALDQYQGALSRATDTTQTAGAINREFAARMNTVGAQIDLLKNSVETLAINLGDLLLPTLRPIVEGLAAGAQGLSDFAKEFPVITGLAGALTTAVAAAGALKVAWLAMGVVGAGVGKQFTDAFKSMNKPLADAIEGVGKLRTGFNLLGAALIGWDIGTYLYNQFEEVREAGLVMVEGLLASIYSLQLGWEQFQAVFTDDTMEAALERYREKLRQLARDMEATRDRSRESAKAQKDGADESAKAAEKQGKAAQQAGDKTAQAMNSAAAAAELARAATEQFSADLQKLGLDADKFSGGITRAEQEVLTAFERMAASGKASGEVILQGVLSGVQKLSADALPDLELAIQTVFEKGGIDVNQLDAALAAVRARAKEVSVEFQAVTRATQALGLDASTAFGGLSDGAQKGISAFQTLQEQSLITADNFDKVFQAALRMQDGAAGVEALSTLIEDLNKKGVVTGLVYEQATAAIRAKLDEVTPGINSVNEAMARFGLQSKESSALAVKGLQEAYDKLVQFNAPLSDQREAWLKLAEAQINANRGVADWGLKAKAAALGLTNQLADLVGKSDQSKAATEALAIGFRQEADVAKRSTEAIRERGTALVAAAQQALETARAQGDALAIEEATVNVRIAEAQAARELATALADEAAAARANANEMERKAAADGLVTDAERKLQAELRATADALTKQAQAADAAADKAEATATKTEQASRASATAVINWDAIAVQYGLAADRGRELADVQAQIYTNTLKSIEGVAGVTWETWADAANQASEAAARYLRALDDVEEAARGGDETLDEYIASLRRAISAGGQLGAEQLRPLRDALRDAQERMKGLEESARSTLNALLDELDQLNENYAAIERRRAAAKRAEIEAQLEVARAAGNQQAVAELQSALSVLQKVTQLRVQEAVKREQEDQRTLQAGGVARLPQQPYVGVSGGTQTTRVVDINIKVGEDVRTVQAVEGSEEVLIDALRKASLVAS